MNKYYGIITSLIAGLSTLIGFLFIYLKGNKEKIISKTLAFAGGVMIMLSIIDLIPTSISNLQTKNNTFDSIIISVIFFLFGFIGCGFLEKIIKKPEGLYKTGVISMAGIIIHNIPEGIATYILSNIDIKLGIVFTIAIIMHNIPEGIGVSIPIYHSTKSKKLSFLYTLLSGMSEPFGAILAIIFLHKYVNSYIIGMLFSMIAGLMIYIGYFELIKSSKKYKNKLKTYNYMLLGSLFILVIEILLKR